MPDTFARTPSRVGGAVDPGVILAGSAAGVLAASKATRTIPLPLMLGKLEDPVAMGLVGGLARPGGNVTGTWTLR